MTVNHSESAQTWCADYDPNFKLHGCELEAHAADKPHRDLTGNEWRESLQVPCPSISNEGKPCGLHLGHFPAKHRPAGAEVWSEDEWTDAIYEGSGPHKPEPSEAAALLAASIESGTPLVVDEDEGLCECGDAQDVHADAVQTPCLRGGCGCTVFRLAAPKTQPEPGPAATYEGQLAECVAELLPDASSEERLELLGVMDEDDMRASLAWLISFAPQIFDFALVRDRQMIERLDDRIEDQYKTEADDLEPYCSACGATIGIFRGRGDSWHHYRGNGTVETPNELYDAGHEPAVSWAPAGGYSVSGPTEDDHPCADPVDDGADRVPLGGVIDRGYDVTGGAW